MKGRERFALGGLGLVPVRSNVESRDVQEYVLGTEAAIAEHVDAAAGPLTQLLNIRFAQGVCARLSDKVAKQVCCIVVASLPAAADWDVVLRSP